MFFVVPNKVEDNAFIDILSDVVNTGLRKLYSVITYDGLMKDVSIIPHPMLYAFIWKTLVYLLFRLSCGVSTLHNILYKSV